MEELLKLSLKKEYYKNKKALDLYKYISSAFLIFFKLI